MIKWCRTLWPCVHLYFRRKFSMISKKNQIFPPACARRISITYKQKGTQTTTRFMTCKKTPLGIKKCVFFQFLYLRLRWFHCRVPRGLQTPIRRRQQPDVDPDSYPEGWEGSKQGRHDTGTSTYQRLHWRATGKYFTFSKRKEKSGHESLFFTYFLPLLQNRTLYKVVSAYCQRPPKRISKSSSTTRERYTSTKGFHFLKRMTCSLDKMNYLFNFFLARLCASKFDWWPHGLGRLTDSASLCSTIISQTTQSKYTRCCRTTRDSSLVCYTLVIT